MKTIEIKAGEKKRIINRISNSIAAQYPFSAVSLKPDEPVTGVVEISGSNWIFPKPSSQQALKKQNIVEKGIWDTFYSVYVTPNVDVNVSLKQTNVTNFWAYLVIGLVTTAIAVSIFVFSMG